MLSYRRWTSAPLLLPQSIGGSVFPHMGDGGLAIGAALKVAKEVDVVHPERIPHIFLGPEYGEDEVLMTRPKLNSKSINMW